ncbi:MAG: sugar phosphate isomerase/epimerase [Victivallaceae bacterium]|nr:sugar phosphate isomerase/epimerase [Victivallaceae bacterium]
MKQIPLVYFVDWGKIADAQIDAAFAELNEMGAKNIVIHPDWWLRDEEKGSFLDIIRKKMLAANLNGQACHGPWRNEYGLSCPDEEQRKKISLSHGRFINRVGDMGCLTYTVHLGENNLEYSKEYLHGQIRKTLDELLPEAEKSGVKIAMENMIDYQMSDEVAALAAEYEHSSLGLCLDVGHAHIKEGIETAIKNMAPYLVTCHLHDNNGGADQHFPPGFGSVDWEFLIPVLKACPRLVNAETEAGQYNGLSRSAAWEIFRNVWLKPEFVSGQEKH